MSFRAFALAGLLCLTACLPLPQETQSALDSVEAMGTPPAVPPEPPQTDYTDCEVKNNKGGPCLIGDRANLDEQPTSRQVARNRALAVPFPAECKTPDMAPDYDNGYSDREVEAIRARLKRANNACVDWQMSVLGMYPEVDTDTDDFGQKFNRVSQTTMDNINLMSAVENAQKTASARKAAAVTPRPSQSSGGDTCANPYGGASAQGGQFICSDQGELLACQCSGGACSLIPTQSYLCTKAGALIR